MRLMGAPGGLSAPRTPREFRGKMKGIYQSVSVYQSVSSARAG